MNQEPQPHQQSNFSNQSNKSDIFSLKRIIYIVFNNWYIFFVAALISGALAYLYNRYTMSTYRVNTNILIEEGNNSSVSETDRMLQGFGLRPGAQNLDNQMLILSSFTLVKRAIGELPFELDFYRKGFRKTASYYPVKPLLVIPDTDKTIPYNVEFSLKPLSKTKYSIEASKNSIFELDTIGTFGEKLSINKGSITLYSLPAMWDLISLTDKKLLNSRQKIFFVFRDQESLTERYRRRVRVQTASRDGTILNISLEGTNKEKNRVFLDKLTEVFLATSLEKKNFEAMRIIDFIDEQLVDVTDSLMIAENRLQEFRSRNRVMDISAQGQQIIQQAVELEDDRANLMLESNYYDYLTRYLSKENTQEVPIAPATMGIADPLLASMMQELADAQAEYLSGGVGEKNPFQGQLQLRIRNTKQSLRETLQGIIEANKMALDENQAQIRTLNARASGLPVTERKLLGIERQFQLNNVLYTFLLQRKSEAQIQKASNKSDNELIDPARADRFPVAPNKRMIYLFALLAGLGIPFLTLLLADTLNDKIASEDELKTITGLPIAGHIPHSKLNYQTVVLNEPQSPVAEAYRSLRTRMQFFTRETPNPIILVTSSIPEEGKTFSAVNLASAYSLAEKKTVLVGFDLRKPKLSPDFGIPNGKGLSTFLIGKDKLEDVIHTTNYPNLDIIPSGPIPPNPAELSDSKKTLDLFKILKKKYDFVIVDTAPVGVVSDGFSLASVADANVIMVRDGKTMRRSLESTLADLRANGITRLSLLINDFKASKGSYKYSYNNRYGDYHEKK